MSDDLSIPSPTYRYPTRSRGMDPATRRLVVIAGGLGVTFLLVIGGWTVLGHRAPTVPIIQATSGPIRVKPENPGGMQVAGANEDILSGGAETGGDKLAPPPEVPAPQDLHAAAPPPALPAPAAVKPQVTPMAPLAPAPVPASTPAPVPAPVAAAPVPAKPAAEIPATAPERHEVTAAAPERVAPASGHTLVQLAAVSSEEAARAEWQRLEKRMGDLLGHHQPSFSKFEHGGRTLWRVRTGGFTDVGQANSFCEHVRAKGAACTIADF